MSAITDTYKLVNGKLIPQVGFGTWQIPGGKETYDSVTWALEAGYLHIDTAAAYRNERSVGEAVRDSGIDRETLYITTKIPAEIKDFDGAMAQIERSLEELGLDYIDLLLIHAPRPWSEMDNPQADKRHEGNAAVWRAMEEAYATGQLKAIGVSNFEIDDLMHLMASAKIRPMVNQIRLSIGHMTNELVDYCKANDILVEAYSPLATGRLLEDERVVKIAERNGVTVAQLSLRYLLAKQLLPLPKSTHKAYIQSNTELDFKLGDEYMAELDTLKERPRG